MGCCGERRRLIRDAERRARAGPGPRWEPAAGRASPERRREGWIYFEYTGPTGLTAYGGVTGRRYRFATHGAVAAIDPRDAERLSRVPNLRQMS